MLSANVGVVGTMMQGCIKVDNDDVDANVGVHELCREGDRHRRRVVRTQEHVEVGKSRCV